jgi:hypothetical protein
VLAIMVRWSLPFSKRRISTLPVTPPGCSKGTKSKVQGIFRLAGRDRDLFVEPLSLII